MEAIFSGRTDSGNGAGDGYGKSSYSMNSSTSKECEICSEAFNEGNHCPKMLPCSHCICTLCVEHLIAGNKMNCPFCRKPFNSNSANDLGTNHLVLDVLKYVKELEVSLRAAPESLKGKRSSTLLKIYKKDNKEIYDESNGRCHRAIYYVKRSIQQNSRAKESILEVRRILKDEILPVLADIDEKAEMYLGFLNKENVKLNRQMDAVCRQEELIGELEDRMQAMPDFSCIDPIVDESKKMIGRTNEVVADLKKFLDKNKKTREGIEERTRKVNDKLGVVKDLLNPADEQREEELDLSSEMVAMATEDDVPRYLNTEYLKTMREPVWNVLEKGRICAVKSLRGRKRYARITVKGNKEFYLHHLGVLKPSCAFHEVDYDDLMKLTKPDRGLTFLELGMGQEYLGRLLICLSPPDSNKAKQFSLLCTGENGPCYANTNCLKVCNKGDDRMEFAVFGDYEQNNGSGGKAAIPDVDWNEEDEKDEHIKRWVKGLVGGRSTENTAALFGIFLRDNRSVDIPGCFGKVENGLEILLDAVARSPDMSRCRIVDCGIVFSL